MKIEFLQYKDLHNFFKDKLREYSLFNLSIKNINYSSNYSSNDLDKFLKIVPISEISLLHKTRFVGIDH